MNKFLKTSALFLFPKVAEILDIRDRLFIENTELKRRIEILENSKNRLFEEIDSKYQHRFQCADNAADFSIKVFDSKAIPGKN